MKTETAIDLCEAIKQYLCAGNPIWNTEKIQEALNMAIDALKAQLSTESTTKGTTFEWISCKDRLPETNGEYLVTAETNNGLEVYQDTYWAECMWDDSGDKVIAWAKMPEPYKGE